MDYTDKRYLEIADLETKRLAHATAGAPYPACRELAETYGTSLRTITRACEVLRDRRLIRRVSKYRGAGSVVTGETYERPGEEITPDTVWRRYRDGGTLWPSADDDGRCPVPGCGRALRNVPRPVWGYACSACITNGAVLTTKAA
ncbi:hypothetical protein [Streptomyces sp. NBC_00069]|uniref:hypothetical protein n=1 Tax=Streptomyces sp. NBC_00069 TaxID=2975639 RepID=UPI003247FBEB